MDLRIVHDFEFHGELTVTLMLQLVDVVKPQQIRRPKCQDVAH